MRFVYKGDLGIIPRFAEKGLGPFELYVRTSKDLKEKLDNFVAVHLQNKLDDGNPVNLAANDSISLAVLKETINCARSNKIKRVVVHPPSINIFKDDREQAIRNFVTNLEKAYDPSVTICIENLSSWINLLALNEPILTRAEQFFEIISYANIPIKMTFDLEHMYEVAVMDALRKKYTKLLKDAYSQKGDMEGIRKQFQEEYPKHLDLKRCNDIVISSILSLKSHIDYLHICGSDMVNYAFNPETGLPLIG
ncbi:MAG: sugar phosphate isomerase/epimerase, partial [Nanoarchaeota archaeon]|nr:sugar phosphate isomerase/epimerase [Nanoarchaeota archaeon]